MKRETLVACLLLAVAAPVAAQTTAAPPRVEVGGQLGALVATDFEGAAAIRLWGPRVSIRLFRNLSIEASTDVRTTSSPSGYHALFGNYYLTGKYAFRPMSFGRTGVFATFGVVGAFARISIPRYWGTLQHGTTIDVAPRTFSRIYRPAGVIAGIGAERRVSSHLAVRMSAEGALGEGYVLGARLLGGVTVPIGTYR